MLSLYNICKPIYKSKMLNTTFSMKDLQQVTSLLLYNVIMEEITQFQIVWIDRIHSNLPVYLNF